VSQSLAGAHREGEERNLTGPPLEQRWRGQEEVLELNSLELVVTTIGQTEERERGERKRRNARDCRCR